MKKIFSIFVVLFMSVNLLTIISAEDKPFDEMLLERTGNLQFNIVFEERDFVHHNNKPDYIEFKIGDHNESVTLHDLKLMFTKENNYSFILDDITNLPNDFKPVQWRIISEDIFNYEFNREKTVRNLDENSNVINIYYDLIDNNISIKIKEGNDLPTLNQLCISAASLELVEYDYSKLKFYLYDESNTLIKEITSNEEGELYFELPFGHYTLKSSFDDHVLDLNMDRLANSVFECTVGIEWFIDSKKEVPEIPVDPIEPTLPDSKDPEPKPKEETPQTPGVEHNKSIVETPNTGLSNNYELIYFSIISLALIVILKNVRKVKRF